MPKLPRISGHEIVRIFERLGFSVVRQRGSHVVLRRNERGCVIPLHTEVAVGTLKNALRQAGVADEEFINAIK
jgi:predicted RNA binding protein YcfA (HicA-like mRNA interferase family)